MNDYILWLPLAAYAVHVLEEAALDWKSWASSSLKIPGLDWFVFAVANIAVMFVAIAAAMVGWKIPSFGLVIPALMLINGLFFHIFPTLIQKKLSPGVITACVLFIPISLWSYHMAYQDGVLTWRVGLLSLLWGGLLMAAPIVFLNVHKKIS